MTTYNLLWLELSKHQLSLENKRQKKKKFLKPISILSKQDHMKQTLGNLEIYVDDMMKYLIT